MTLVAGFLKLLGPAGIVGLALTLALSALLGIQTHKTHVAQKAAASWEQKYDGEHAALIGTVANYRIAAEQARKADAENVARVRAEQAVINKKANDEYEARLADARAHAERLRSQLAEAAAHPSGPGAAPVSGPHATPSGPHGPAAEDGLSLDDRLLATEQAIQLDELIKWLHKNLTVDFGNSSPSSPSASH